MSSWPEISLKFCFSLRIWNLDQPIQYTVPCNLVFLLQYMDQEEDLHLNISTEMQGCLCRVAIKWCLRYIWVFLQDGLVDCCPQSCLLLWKLAFQLSLTKEFSWGFGIELMDIPLNLQHYVLKRNSFCKPPHLTMYRCLFNTSGSS